MIMHSGIAPHSRRPGADWGRIAVLAHTHPSVTKGGAEVAAYSLYRGLNALGVDAILSPPARRQSGRACLWDPATNLRCFTTPPFTSRFTTFPRPSYRTRSAACWPERK